MKKRYSLIHAEQVPEAVLDLKRRNDLIAANVVSVRCGIVRGAFGFAGDGRSGLMDLREIGPAKGSARDVAIRLRRHGMARGAGDVERYRCGHARRRAKTL